MPYDDSAHVVYMTGTQLKHALLHMLRDDTLEGKHAEFFQVSHGLEVEYDQASRSLIRCDYEGTPVDDEQVYAVGIQHYFYREPEYSFDLTLEELRENRPDCMVATSCADIIEEVLPSGEYKDAPGEGRVVIHLAND